MQKSILYRDVAALNGLFFAAGDVTNDGAIAVADYSAVVNTAVRG